MENKKPVSSINEFPNDQVTRQIAESHSIALDFAIFSSD